MPPQSDLSIIIQRGTTSETFIQFTDTDGAAIDITGWTFTGAQIRQGIGSDATLLVAFTVAIVGNATDGTIKLSLTPTQTNALTAQNTSSGILDNAAPRWDLLYIDDEGVTRRFPQDSPGLVRVCDGVTQA